MSSFLIIKSVMSELKRVNLLSKGGKKLILLILAGYCFLAGFVDLLLLTTNIFLENKNIIFSFADYSKLFFDRII